MAKTPFSQCRGVDSIPGQGIKSKILHATTKTWYSQISTFFFLILIFKKKIQGFPGGSVVKNPPANAGDTGLIPIPGRSHMPQGSLAHAPQLSLCPRAQGPAATEP